MRNNNDDDEISRTLNNIVKDKDININRIKSIDAYKREYRKVGYIRVEM